ncbi:MAG: glycine cleavage system protein R [endosymbiont of Galathealinum brachiosum]|uniref:Glycine cleavage system transcriptional repressor n=1 Tax=endosymbiont of Galathealinum brachiosum TaxID=2200906 RepID=A0A370D8N9_9GAMM|nr:MAG: glycine cleavage system protein R [endosymbiont of Galathealinum brachiosum]
MNQSLVITAIGADRPGIVNELTEVLLNSGLNVEDSRMSVLGGEFAVMLLVTGNEDAINSVKQQTDKLATSLNLSLLCKETSSHDENQEHSAFTINVEGMDNPGIVHKLARYLSQHSINIVNMHTESKHAPHTGTPIFSVNMQVNIPAEQNIEQIEADFSVLCDEMNMDAEFKPAT